MSTQDDGILLPMILDPATAALIEAFRVELQALDPMSEEEARGRVIHIMMQAFLRMPKE